MTWTTALWISVFCPFSFQAMGPHTVVIFIFLSVSVTFVESRVPAFSMAAASRTRIPDRAARPTPTITEIGVASPRAHGQAMINTEMALANAKASAGCGPHSVHTAKVTAAVKTTAGAK